jgi:hypothetical protein
MSDFPLMQLPPNFIPGKRAAANGTPAQRADAHLRSTRSISGYHLQASDGIAGHVSDFMMDTLSWAICQLVIRTGHPFSGKEVLLPTNKVERISYEQSTVFVNLTQEAIKQAPESDPALVTSPISAHQPVLLL